MGKYSCLGYGGWAYGGMVNAGRCNAVEKGDRQALSCFSFASDGKALVVVFFCLLQHFRDVAEDGLEGLDLIVGKCIGLNSLAMHASGHSFRHRDVARFFAVLAEDVLVNGEQPEAGNIEFDDGLIAREVPQLVRRKKRRHRCS